MNEALKGLHTAGPRDGGCDEATAALNVYVDLVAADRAVAVAADPGVAVNPAARGPCREDFDGLLAAALV